MSELVRQGGDIVAGLAFSVALVIVMLTPLSPARGFNRWTKWLAAGGLLIYVFSSGSDALGGVHIGDQGELLEDYLETLFPLVVLGAVFSAYASQQYHDLLASQRAFAQSHALTMQIVDGAPSGIVFLDSAGRLAFANGTAEEMLGLSENVDTGAPTAPGVVIVGEDGTRAEDFSALLSREPYRGRFVTAELADGSRVDLEASGRPLGDSPQQVGGIVVTLRPAMQRPEA